MLMIESRSLAKGSDQTLNLDDSRENGGRCYSARGKKSNSWGKKALALETGLECTHIPKQQLFCISLGLPSSKTGCCERMRLWHLAVRHCRDRQHPWDKGSLESTQARLLCWQSSGMLSYTPRSERSQPQ